MQLRCVKQLTRVTHFLLSFLRYIPLWDNETQFLYGFHLPVISPLSTSLMDESFLGVMIEWLVARLLEKKNNKVRQNFVIFSRKYSHRPKILKTSSKKSFMDFKAS